MPEYARKANIPYCDFSLEMYQLPNGSIKPSLSQAGATLGKHHSSFMSWAKGNSPEAQQYRQFLIAEYYSKEELEGLNSMDLSIANLLERGITLVNIGSGFLNTKLMDTEGLILYWTYWANRGEITAQAYLAAGTKETIMRRANEVFGIVKTEQEYQQESTQDFYNFKVLLETYLVPIQNELKVVRENQLKIAPFVEAGKVIMTIYKYFPNYENLLAQVASVFDNTVNHNYLYLKDSLYSLGFRGVSHGEKINIARTVCGFSELGNSEWIIKKSPTGRKQYAEALLPIIREATLLEFSKRNNVRLIK